MPRVPRRSRTRGCQAGKTACGFVRCGWPSGRSLRETRLPAVGPNVLVLLMTICCARVGVTGGKPGTLAAGSELTQWNRRCGNSTTNFRSSGSRNRCVRRSCHPERYSSGWRWSRCPRRGRIRNGDVGQTPTAGLAKARCRNHAAGKDAVGGGAAAGNAVRLAVHLHTRSRAAARASVPNSTCPSTDCRDQRTRRVEDTAARSLTDGSCNDSGARTL